MAMADKITAMIASSMDMPIPAIVMIMIVMGIASTITMAINTTTILISK